MTLEPKSPSNTRWWKLDGPSGSLKPRSPSNTRVLEAEVARRDKELDVNQRSRSHPQCHANATTAPRHCKLDEEKDHFCKGRLATKYRRPEHSGCGYVAPRTTHPLATPTCFTAKCVALEPKWLEPKWLRISKPSLAREWIQPHAPNFPARLRHVVLAKASIFAM
eukprot:1812958-Amphidinium_carterae.2